ncbi:MFS transporter [Desulfohalobium retbaense]|uniref:Major facilitator superfamily MFS_1 n=1 Tax=Desulfohalobium retbaense (strain ATCC 49708 / DSM 5692 / JCM 16813 / HR100) TaxID=485915 RepID=C8X5E1_DESRD|nr:MFS transporter [Desulfohalobium retbaense]ACV69638.1 major facilitator superfamily MFS_1 [Desulfohalobium retbaense DSM 5692]
MRVLHDLNLCLLLLVVMFAVTGGSLVGPILPEMIAPLGATQQTVGLALSVYTLGALITTPIFGVLADRVGRKRIIVPTTLLFGIAGLLITLTESFWLVLVYRALQGIGVGGMMNSVIVAIGDRYSGIERQQAMGYRVTAQGLTNAAVPFLSGALATIAWFLPFYIHSLAIAVGLLAAWKLEEPVQARPSANYLTQALAAVLTLRAFWLFFSNFMGFFLLYCLVVYMPLFVVNELGHSTLHAGLALSVGAGVNSLVATQAGRLRRRFSEETLVLTGFLCAGIALLALGLSPTYGTMLLCFVLWGLGFGALMPTLNAAAAGLVSAELRGGVLSLFTLLIYLGQTVSPLFFALFLKNGTVHHTFFIASGLTLLPLSLTLLVRSRQDTT